MNLSTNAIKVLETRYLAKDLQGNVIETPEDLFRRVARAVAAVDIKYVDPFEVDRIEQAFYEVMTNLEFLPNSPTLMNAGRPLGQLSACFVLPIEDTMEGIFQSIKNAALIHKSGGGTGFSFSRLRGKGSTVNSTGGVASGPVSFMKVFNAATEAVKQGGTRRGANMGILRIDHPDILEFISCKKDNADITNFNISVGITEEFMKAVESNSNYNLIDPHDLQPVGELNAKEVFDIIVDMAWNNGEPGIVFLDRLNKDNITPALGEIESTNPCLTGDTIIRTVEGPKAIKDLVGQVIDVYCMDNNENITIATATNIRCTKRNAKLVEITTTRGTLRCTPDHKIYTKNRGYVEAAQLEKKDKIVGLNMKCDDIHIAVGLTGKKYIREHRFVASHYYDIEGKDVHHKDDNHQNNSLSNLEVLPHGTHSVASNVGHIGWSTRDNKGRFNGSNNKQVTENTYSTSLGRKVGVNLHVSSVKVLEYTEDVYDMTVEKYHNFIANEIVVHNCGEQPLLPYEACNLGSINVSKFYNPTTGGVDYDRLRNVVHIAVRFLDNVIDANKYPLPEIDKMTRSTRKIGLGLMGWADLLCMIGIPYNSLQAVQLAERVMSFIQTEAWDASKVLAKIKGVFPEYDDSILTESVRNATTTTIAPTGTISIIASCSSGVEPLFAISYIRNIMDNREFVEVNPLFEKIAKQRGFYTEELMKKIAQKGTIHGIEEIPIDVQNIFVTAHDISPIWHTNMQAAFQKYTDNAVSKTVNLGHEATREDVKEVYMHAYSTGCKGVTIYRDGSRTLQPLNIGKVKGKEEATAVIPRVRPDITTGVTEKVQIGCGKLYITANYDDQGICEVFTNTGRTGGCPSQSEATSRLISIALRSGIDVASIVSQLKGIRCPSTIRQKGLKVLSCPDAIGRLIEKAANKQAPSSSTEELTAAACPECGKKVEHEGGCVVCKNCGYSKCG